MRYDAVLIQECKADFFSAATVAGQLRGWRIYWAHNTLAHGEPAPASAAAQPPLASVGGTNQPPPPPPPPLPGSGGSTTNQNSTQSSASQPAASQQQPAGQQRQSAGVAIAVCLQLLQGHGGSATVSGDWRTSDGRLISLRLSWGGHSLQLASIYMPNDSAAQRSLIQNSLAALAQQARPPGQRACAMIWGGDFNFVESVQHDRRTSRQSHSAERSTAAAWQQQLQQLQLHLVDAYRHRHPRATTFTHFHPAGAARLDRFYISSSLLPCLAAATIGERLPSTAGALISDHRPITLALLPANPTTIPRNPVRRLRLQFAADAALAQRFQQLVTAAAATAPTDAAAFVAWWPWLKRRAAAAARDCNQRWRAAQRRRSTPAFQQVQQLYEQYEAGDNAALAGLLQRRQQLAADVAAELADASMQQRRQWLHDGERPSPALTQRLKKPAAARGVPALRSPSGALHTSPQACAQLTAKFWAGVSSTPQVCPMAQQEVLAALQTAPQLSQQQADELGAASVTAAEVRRALKRSKAGTAPGRDGIPVQLYRRFAELFQPLLTRLFSGIGASGQLPRGFTGGVISVLHKKGDPCNPANYRPITLLNTDYRLLAKVLAGRLGAHLPSIIGAEQTAFLSGRSIGENVHLLQLLPELLRREQRWALVVLCDFCKAYDTVDRGFLLAVMRQLGLGDGFLRWTHLLLARTQAAALVNGHLSNPALFKAGVRQGCPLAPLLYLCLAQALLRFLQHRDVGISAAGQQLAALQFADDCKTLVEGGSQQQISDRVAEFLAAMQTFAAASGQQLSAEKTKILPIGQLPAWQLPPTIHGLQVVQTATVLGLQFASGTQQAQTDWQPRLQLVEQCYTKLAAMRLSAFGRGISSAAYGVSTLLYQAEYAGMPPPAALQQLSTITSKLVDRGLAPASTVRRFAGLPGELLAGSPRSGGFGALPWEQHVRARHAAWGVRLALAEPSRPWAAVARALLQQVDQQLTPLGLLIWQHSDRTAGQLPPALRRMWEGLRALPPVQPVGIASLQPGAWCCRVPLWGNPLLQLPGGGSLDERFADLAETTISYIPDLVAAHQQLQQCQPRQYTAALRQRLFGASAATFFLDPLRSREQLAALIAALPPAWVDAAWRHRAAPASEAEAAAALLGSWGWQRQQEPLTLVNFRVRHGTQLQLSGLQQQRQQRFAAFEALAGDGDGAQPDGATVAALLPRLWRLPWDNKHKEVYWRLVLNALPVAARMPSAAQPCGCGAAHPHPDRRHHFWDCPVAAAVTSSLSAQLGGRHLTPQHLWLAQPPPTIHAGVWEAVCLAAVAAMDGGRRQMTARQLATPATAAGPELAAAASRHAVARLWELLQDFCSVGAAPASWRGEVPPDHPFLRWQPGAQRWLLIRVA